MMSLNGSEVSTYGKPYTRLDNLLLVLVKKFTNSLPSDTVVSVRNSVPKIGECYPFFVICLGNIYGKTFF